MCFCRRFKKEIEGLKQDKISLKNQNQQLQEIAQNEREAKEKCWESYEKCKEELEECKGEDEEPKPIKSLIIKNGKFAINDKITKLIGVSKREMLAVGSGDLPESEVNYKYKDIKTAILNSECNYVRVIIPLDINFARKEIESYLNLGIVVEAELFDAANPSRKYQTHWKTAFNTLKDLPIFFDAHNEFMDLDLTDKVRNIIKYVTYNGGLVGAGAWGSSAHGKEYSDILKNKTDKYQIVTHHRQWIKASIDADRETGKCLLMNELHTRDHNLSQIKQLMKDMYNWCDGVQVYSLLNWGSGEGSNFQKLLNYIGEIK